MTDKVDLSSVTNGQNVSAINDNFVLIEDALNNGVLWRDNPNSDPNQMLNDLDMNGNNILNIDSLSVETLVVNGEDVNASVEQAVQAAASASTSANAAATSATQAAASANSASATLASSLKIANNLSDVNNAATSLANLGGVNATQAAAAAPVQSVAGRTGAVVLTSTDVGLANVNNTSDANKPVSTATQTALNLKANYTANTFTGAQTISDTTQSTSSTTGSFITAGGVGIAKDIYCAGAYHGAGYLTSGGISSTPISGSTGSFTSIASTGDITLSKTSPNYNINDSSGTGTATIWFNSSGTAKWNLQMGTSNFTLGRYVSGSLVDFPISVANATGNVTIADALVINGAVSAANTQDSTSGSTGSINTLGGIGITKALYVGTTITAAGLIKPTSAVGILGTVAADSAQAGSIGEYTESAISASTAITLATATNLASISLTAGDWDVEGIATYTSGTTLTQCISSISTTSATSAGPPRQSQQAVNLTSGQVFSQTTMRTRINVSTTTIAYLVGFVNGTGSPTYTAVIRARRVR